MIKHESINIVNEVYSKCIKQKQDITDGINEIMKGIHKSGAVDKVKFKILEKLENFEESLKMIEKVISELTTNQDIWRKKVDNLRISLSNMHKHLDEAVSLQRKRNKSDNLFSLNKDLYSKSNSMWLHEENTSLVNASKIGADLERQALSIHNELEDQMGLIGKMFDKVNVIYRKMDVSNSISKFLVRRGRGDTYLCLFMGVITVLSIYFSYYYLRPWVRGENI